MRSIAPVLLEMPLGRSVSTPMATISNQVSLSIIRNKGYNLLTDLEPVGMYGLPVQKRLGRLRVAEGHARSHP